MEASVPAEPITDAAVADEIFAARVTVEACASASADFPALWAKRPAPGGTLESDRNNFVLGAAYGLAWAMNHLRLDGDGNVELANDAASGTDFEKGCGA
jgi:hypothetical protein